MKHILTIVFVLASLMASAAEHTVLLGPKTIRAGWKDNIVILPAQFQNVKAGDILTIYTLQAKGNAQGALQDPQGWQAVEPQFGYFAISNPTRLRITSHMVEVMKTRGIALAGHDYVIARVTLTPAEDYEERQTAKGLNFQMADDWSKSATLGKKAFEGLQIGDGIRFDVSKVQPGAAIKLMDFTYNALNSAVDGAQVGADGYTYYISEHSQLLQLQLADGEGTVMRVGGKGYRLDGVTIVHRTGGIDEDESTAQRAPKEFRLGPGEIFHGEKDFPADWSGNERITAEPFQKSTANDCLVISYKLLPGSTKGQLSLRENHGKWFDLTGAKEPVWYDLTGNDLVYTLDNPEVLDKVKTHGLVVTGQGFQLTRIELMHVE